MLDLDGAAAGEALLVIPERAGGVDRPGVDADVALDDDLGGGLLAGGHEGDGRGGEEGESELGHFDELVSADGVGVRADRVFLRLSSGCEACRARRGEFASALWQRALARTPAWSPRCQCARARRPSGSRGSNVATCRGRDLLALPKRRRKPRNSRRRTISS